MQGIILPGKTSRMTGRGRRGKTGSNRLDSGWMDDEGPKTTVSKMIRIGSGVKNRNIRFTLCVFMVFKSPAAPLGHRPSRARSAADSRPACALFFWPSSLTGLRMPWLRKSVTDRVRSDQPANTKAASLFRQGRRFFWGDRLGIWDYLVEELRGG